MRLTTPLRACRQVLTNQDLLIDQAQHPTQIGANARLSDGGLRGTQPLLHLSQFTLVGIVEPAKELLPLVLVHCVHAAKGCAAGWTTASTA